MRKNILSLTIATLLMVGCDKVVDTSVDTSNEIRVEASMKQARASGTSFDIGDKMGLYAVEYNGDEVASLQVAGNFINNEALTYDGSVWSGDRTLYWSGKPCDFYGIYPYQELTTVSEYLFNLPTDQNSPETDDALSGYEAADIMWAKATKVSREDDAVQLQFKHMMSRVVVKIERGDKYEGELPEDITVHLYNTVTTAEVDFTHGSLQRYAHGEKNTIIMKQLSGDTFAAIVVPQNIERRTPLVEITMEGIAYLLNYSMSFRPGYQHTITVTLNSSPEQEKIEISIDGEIEDWD
ncbi:MAG: fimbrillin family protein [Alistipes sp.]|nr:fimbrillin family protein [Alistipes sp.]